MNFETVTKFEQALAEYFGAPFAVATDCCTHAIELCIRHRSPVHVLCPTHTYISVPFTLEKTHTKWGWIDRKWNDYYFLESTDIIDAAVHWKANGYFPNSLMCLSFQFKKPLNLGRGGAILCSSAGDYAALKAMSYDGRYNNTLPWAKQKIHTIGYHYYMTPETAQIGLDKLPTVTKDRNWSWKDYPDLRNMPVFNKSM